MKVAPTQPFRIVYSILEHEFLGYLIEAFVVQLNGRGELTLQNQTLSTQNVGEFVKGLDERDFELVRLLETIQQDAILKKFNSRKLPAVDFFLKIYDPQKGDKLVQEAICTYIENVKAQVLERLSDKPVYIMGNDGNPAWAPVEWMPEPARVHFHFVRNADSTHYFPIIRYGDRVRNGDHRTDDDAEPTQVLPGMDNRRTMEATRPAARTGESTRVEFQHKGALLLCDDPAWMLVDDRLYHFARHVEGKKLRPFLNKNHIVIPRNIEEQYYQRFVVPLIAAYDVYAKGFEIRSETLAPVPVLTVSEQAVASQRVGASLFGDAPIAEEEAGQKMAFDLSFQYGQFQFRFDSFANSANVSVEKMGDDYVFHKIRRDQKVERQKLNALKEVGLDLRSGRLAIDKAQAFDWLATNSQLIQDAGFLLRQNESDTKRYFLGYSSLNVSIEEGRDWFDIYANVRFGEFEIPFIKLRSLILNKKREFTLPNGEVAVIPDAWFTKYSELLGFLETPDGLDDGRARDRLILQKHHLALVQQLEEDNLASAVISRKLERLREFDEIESYILPTHFRGTLRPYQKAGFDWMNFLNQYRFGGCLADDMGLGKTVMTLALLQGQKEAGALAPTLLVMPTSLLYNWELEAKRFTPDLRVMTYTGTYRDKNTAQFDGYDLILTSYGIVRIDIDLLKDYRFNYVILDESQAIKNPASHITKAVMQLNAGHRLILTGTPLENSTMDLWTQMTFINPGLLGSQTFFRNEFQIPIEKRNDEQKTARLYGLIKPFMLRRNKAQVATDLPAKVESVLYSEMTPEQADQYEEAKSYYRNLILERIEEEGMAKSQMIVLQGLTKLRQIANHPRMIDATYEGDSGKLSDVLMRLEIAMAENHKILVFSQFIKHLNVVREYLAEKNIKYAYLDGSTTDRRSQVELFQTDDSVKLFLISLKAGGLGHNLTAADYVFILDPWWNPAIEAQAVDRAHRIGQQRTVFTYKFISKNTVEEKILTLQQAKQRLASNLVSSEEGFVKSLTKEDVLVLLE